MSTEHATYRIRRFARRDVPSKDYRGSYEILDHRTGHNLARCDISGHALFAETPIVDRDGLTWFLTPNRKIMPTRWVLRGPDRAIAVQFDQNLPKKLVNPLYRAVLTLFDGRERELFRVVDPRQSTADRILGVGPDEWAIMSGDKPVGKISRLAPEVKPATGFLQKVRNMLTESDRSVVSFQSEHVLAAPVALALLIIVHELTSTASAA